MARGERPSPRSLVVDLLRVIPNRSIAVSAFVHAGQPFGFTGNAVRVAITRLVADGLVESDERGFYRLAPRALPLSSHVEAWRLGEDRMRAWRGAWLAVWLARGAERAVRRRSIAALGRLGFSEGLDGLWVRPDNLAQPEGATLEKLAGLGLEDGAEPVTGARFSERAVRRFRADLWPVRQIARTTQGALAALRRSEARLSRMNAPAAAVETFVVGGAAIRALATDPLLPDEIASGDDRRALTLAMLRYDEIGRRIWTALARGAALGPAASADALAGVAS